jgi:hypothetical protein
MRGLIRWIKRLRSERGDFHRKKEMEWGKVAWGIWQELREKQPNERRGRDKRERPSQLIGP